jgi:hypothetical protein
MRWAQLGEHIERCSKALGTILSKLILRSPVLKSC